MDERLRDLKYKYHLDDVLRRWLEYNNDDDMQEAGKELEQFRLGLPKEYLRSPSNTLYRCVLIKKALLEKHKPLILENREYSSWTYSPEAAKKFGSSRYVSEGYVLAILKHRFSDNEIFLNAEKLSAELLYGYMEDEKEIIVKNVKKSFTFQPREIYLIKQKEGGPWMFPFEVLSLALKNQGYVKLAYQIQALSEDRDYSEESTTTTAYFNYYYWNPAHPGDVGPCTRKLLDY